MNGSSNKRDKVENLSRREELRPIDGTIERSILHTRILDSRREKKRQAFFRQVTKYFRDAGAAQRCFQVYASVFRALLNCRICNNTLLQRAKYPAVRCNETDSKSVSIRLSPRSQLDFDRGLK